MNATRAKWDWELSPGSPDWDGGVKGILTYRHLIWSIVRRNFLLNFQQTILGPAWLFVQPLLTLLVYVTVFGKLIGLATGNAMPQVLFYFTGIVLWNFFNESFAGVSRTYRDNIHVFSKVYFPRIIAPVALMLTQFFRFLIQFSLLIPLIIFYIYTGKLHFTLRPELLLLPFVLLAIGMLSFSSGLVLSVVTAKYRDIANLVDLCIRLLFFATPVLYPLAAIRQDMRWIVNLNPLTHLFELFRKLLFGEGTIQNMPLLWTGLFIITCFFLAIYIFNKYSNRLIDLV